mgnify:CR=1 FL=1|tara:strand:+ start:127 stop:822 length:696 start_codon:yes stop_codon:yes gene_type:complete
MSKFIDKLSILKKKIYSTKKSYSFGGCDLLIDYIFKSQKKGFYLDVGCQHPISNNNTYLLYKRGWSGMNIDLDPKNIRLFDLDRPDEINICKCVSSDNSKKDLFFFHSGSPINSLEKKTIKDKTNFSLKKIETFTLNSILKDYKIKEIDYFNIDVEGHEIDILKNFDIKYYKPKVISVEFIDYQMKKLEFKNNNINRVLKSDLYRYFISNDYHFVNWSHADLIFVHKDFKD